MPTSKKSGRPRATTDSDKAIGMRIRSQRLARGFTQEALAEALDISFQQVQKYEKGTNRLSSGRLIKAAAVLGVGVERLLGFNEQPTSESDFMTRFVSSKDGVALARYFDRLPPEERASLLGLMKALAEAHGASMFPKLSRAIAR